MKSKLKLLVASFLCGTIFMSNTFAAYATTLDTPIATTEDVNELESEQIEDENEVVFTEQSLSQTVDDTIVTVSGNLPINAYITVSPVNVSEYEQIINENETELFTAYQAFDVCVFFEDGTEYQPVEYGETLSVSFENIAVTETCEDLIVYRIEDEEVTEIEVTNTEVTGTTGDVDIVTDHFTVYVIGDKNCTINDNYGAIDDTQLIATQDYVAPDGNTYHYIQYDSNSDGISDYVAIRYVTVNSDTLIVPETIDGLPVLVFGYDMNDQTDVAKVGASLFVSAFTGDCTFSEVYINTPVIMAGAFGGKQYDPVDSDLTDNPLVNITIGTLTIGESVELFQPHIVTVNDYNQLGQFYNCVIDTVNYNAVSAKSTEDSILSYLHVDDVCGVFAGSTISHLNFGANVRTIPQFCFFNAKINTELLSINVPNIGYSAFRGTDNHYNCLMIGEAVTTFLSDNYDSMNAFAPTVTFDTFAGNIIDELKWNATNCAIGNCYHSDPASYVLNGAIPDYGAAFYGATISDYSFGSDVEYIPSGLFFGANVTAVKDVTFQDVTIGQYAFYGVDFSSVTLTGNVSFPLSDRPITSTRSPFYGTIGTVSIQDLVDNSPIGTNGVFSGCTITTINHVSQSKFSAPLFKNCTIANLNYNNSETNSTSVSRSGYNTYEGDTYTNITFGSNVREIPKYFMGGANTNYTGDLNLPEGIATIRDQAFSLKGSSVSIENATIPSTVTAYGYNSFLVPATNMYVKAVEIDYWYDKNGTKLQNTGNSFCSLGASSTDIATIEALYENVYIHGNSDLITSFTINPKLFIDNELFYSYTFVDGNIIRTTNETDYSYGGYFDFDRIIDIALGSSTNVDWLCDGTGVYIETRAATCTEDGGRYFECSVCGYGYTEDTIPALGHDYVNAYHEYSSVTGTYSKGNYGVRDRYHCGRCDTILDVKYSMQVKAVPYASGSSESGIATLQIDGVDATDCSITYDLNDGNGERTLTSAVWTNGPRTITWSAKENWVTTKEVLFLYNVTNRYDTFKRGSVSGSIYSASFDAMALDNKGPYVLYVRATPYNYVTVSATSAGTLDYDGSDHDTITGVTSQVNGASTSGVIPSISYAVISREQYDALCLYPDANKLKDTALFDETDFTWTATVPTMRISGDYYILVRGEAPDRITGYDWAHAAIAAHTHNYTLSASVPPTCTTPGSNTYTCSSCGDTYDDEISELGHLPGEPVMENRVEPTEDEDGHFETVIYCERCDAELSRVLTTIPRVFPLNPPTPEPSKPDIVLPDEPINPIIPFPEPEPDPGPEPEPEKEPERESEPDIKVPDIFVPPAEEEIEDEETSDDVVYFIEPTPSADPDENDEVIEKRDRNVSAVAVVSAVVGLSGGATGAFFFLIWWRRRKIKGTIIVADDKVFRVTLEGKDKLETTTDAYGEFLFRNLKEDTYILSIYDEDEALIFCCDIYTKGSSDNEMFTIIDNQGFDTVFTRGKTIEIELS